MMLYATGSKTGLATENKEKLSMALPQNGFLSPVESHRVLFIIYINDIDVGLSNFISKFADDMKFGNSIITDHVKKASKRT